MRTKRFETVKCPKCGMEYLPAEVFIPDAFVGKPSNIVKDEEGSIVSFSGKTMSTEEEYTCDRCGVTFTISSKISFSCDYDDRCDFDEEYVSKIYSPITMKEDWYDSYRGKEI